MNYWEHWFGLFSKLIKWISDLVGIAAPVNIFILFWIFVFIDHYFCVNGLLFRVSIRMKQLAQELALYENKMNDEQNTHS